MNQDKAKAPLATPTEGQSGDAGEVPGYVKVMTDQQVEVLRKQIAVYATICEQLLEMHRAFLTSHHEYAAGASWPGAGSNLYRDPPPMVVHGGGGKFTARQRWAPTQTQLQILETIFGEGNGTLPGKQRITDITAELSQHGQVAETNVYNWFQNRRARARRNLKRKQAALLLPNNTESEAQARSSASTK